MAVSLDGVRIPAWRASRPWFWATAAIVVIAVTIQLFVTGFGPPRFFATTAGRVANVFSFFTIQSNLIVGVTSLLLATGRARDSALFRAFRLAGIVNIVITGVVYGTLLVGLVELSPWGGVADFLLHRLVPLLAPLIWLAYGPRGLTSWRVVGHALLYPIGWLAFTLARGAAIGWYPYPFLNVETLGYPRALVNCLGIAVAFVAVAALFTALDGWLARRGIGASPRDAVRSGAR